MARRTLVSFGLVALGGCVLALAFAGPDLGQAHPNAPSAGTFRVAFFVQPGGIESIDPALPGSAWRERLLRPACAQLMAFPGPRPELAAGYPKMSNDRRTYIFTIRKGVRFNNGRPLTARNFARAFERALHPDMRLVPVEYAELFVGGRAYYERRASAVSGIAASGNTLRIRLTEPVPSFLEDIAGRPICAVPAELPIDAEGAPAPLASPGPYYVSRFLPGREVVLTRNPRYRGGRPRPVATYAIDLANTPATAVDQVASGRADLAVPFSLRYDELAARYGVNKSRFFLFSDGTVLQSIVLNTRRALFRTAKMRKAVSFAVDRRALTAAHSRFFGLPTDQFLSPAVAGFRDVRIYPPGGNLRRARSLVGARPRVRTAVLYTSEVPASVAQAELIRRQLRAIRIDVRIRRFAEATYYARLETPGEPFDMAVTRFEQARPSPSLLYCMFHRATIPTAAGGCNLSRFDSRQYSRRLARAERLVGRARFRLYGALDVELARDAAAAVPIVHPARAVFVSRRAGCHRFSRPLFDLATVCLKRR